MARGYKCKTVNSALVRIMSEKHTILLVDDEENILNSLYRLLRRERVYEVLMAKSGAEGLEILKNRVSSFKMQDASKGINLQPATCNSPVSLIVSDQRMPVMEGVEFLARAKELSPDTTRIMLTGYADINAVAAAVNRGEILRYVTKPWEDETLLSVIRQGIEQYELITERKRLLDLTTRQNEELAELNHNLEKKVEERTKEVKGLYKKLKSNFHDTIRVFVNLIGHYDRHLGGHVKRVSVLAEGFAKYLGLDEREVEEIEIASLLHDIGLIGVPRVTLAKEMEDLTFHELNLIKQHPGFAQSLLYSIENLHQAGIIIRSHHERFDGSGYPDGLKGEEIPYGSRIIAVCDAYDETLNKRSKDKRSEGAALRAVKTGRGIFFDPDIANSFLSFASGHKQAVSADYGKEVAVFQLQAGMTLLKDVVTKSGKLLVQNGAVLSSHMIERLRSFHELDPIVEGICIKG
jgi:response regulator RpfG family c-di-GMP phosphodiesterase